LSLGAFQSPILHPCSWLPLFMIGFFSNPPHIFLIILSISLILLLLPPHPPSIHRNYNTPRLAPVSSSLLPRPEFTAMSGLFRVYSYSPLLILASFFQSNPDPIPSIPRYIARPYAIRVHVMRSRPCSHTSTYLHLPPPLPTYIPVLQSTACTPLRLPPLPLLLLIAPPSCLSFLVCSSSSFAPSSVLPRSVAVLPPPILTLPAHAAAFPASSRLIYPP
jgi:hypothetical protein